MDRSVELPVAMLGVMKAGAAFVPMDVHWPAQRAQLIIRDTESTVVLVTQAAPLAAHVPEGARAVEIQVDKLAPAAWQAPAMSSQDPIYMIYTSGSTGLPKGAINKHVGIVNRLSYMTRRYGCSPQDVILQTSAHIFDASVWQYFWPLINGAVSVLPSPMAGFDHRHVTELVGRYKVTVTDFVPSVFNIMVDILEQDEDLRQRLSSLRQLLIGGEALSPKAVFRFLQRYPQASITNTYGPTETSIGVIFYEVKREYEEPLPIGRPIANVNAYILDESMQPVPIGVPGMLYVGGVCVGLGYHHDAQKTAAVFVPNPFPEVHPGPIYKTGDLARFRESGDIEFLGRADHQVKIRGVRIELGEIEAKLNKHPGVQSAVVNVWETPDGAKRLAAYLVPLEGDGPSTEELRAFLKETLPEYVIPGAFVRMPQMPLLRSGKVDRKALPPPAIETDRTRPTGQPPRTATQKLIAQAWQEEIGRDDVCIHDNFFELGGDSLAALKVLARLEMEFGIRLEAEQMMNQTLGQLAAALPGAQDDDADEALAEPSLPTLQAFYFGPAEHGLFGTLQMPAAGGSPRGGVVVCAPLGHEYLFTHRCLRHLSQLLAGQGQAVMRFDYWGTGDSLGEAEEVTLPSCQQSAHTALVETGQRLPGLGLAVIGLRLGAPVAAQAAARIPGVDRIILWDPVTSGDAYLGELRAVHERLFGGCAGCSGRR
jgi:amino acid adenylation domain-containing protein